MENRKAATYLIEVSHEIGRGGFRITYERLIIAKRTIYEKPRSEYGNREVVVNDQILVKINLDKPALLQLSGSELISQQERGEILSVSNVFENIYVPYFSPDRMRLPSFLSQYALGDQGENLPSILYNICNDNKQNLILMEWLRALTPMEVNGFSFGYDRFGRIHLGIGEKSGAMISAYSASDGTLRFLAMLATLLGKDAADIYFLEEIENGIHPSRLHLLVDLIETQAMNEKIQVIATTHSPGLLSAVNDETFRHTSVVCRQEGTSDAIIRPVSKIANAKELRKSQGLGRLLAGGWMETALAFTEDDKDGEGTPG